MLYRLCAVLPCEVEKTYPCLGITCEEVGFYQSAGVGKGGMTACSDASTTPAAVYDLVGAGEAADTYMLGLSAGCDEVAWPFKRDGPVCGECKVQLDGGSFMRIYGSCDGYCSSIGRTCTGAWTVFSDTCAEENSMDCNQAEHATGSDPICECRGEVNAACVAGNLQPFVCAPAYHVSPNACAGTTVLMLGID